MRLISRYSAGLIDPGRTRATERYDVSLRKLGAWLDAALAYCVSVTEVEHGFVVRYHNRDMEPVFAERFFPRAEVVALRLGDLRLRRRFAGRIGGRLQGVALEPGGYQDLFRAIGHDLDQHVAMFVALREEDDMLILIYSTEDGEQETRLSPRDRTVLRVAARSRREHKRWGWRG
jgi:hypothetical protein